MLALHRLIRKTGNGLDQKNIRGLNGVVRDDDFGELPGNVAVGAVDALCWACENRGWRIEGDLSLVCLLRFTIFFEIRSGIVNVLVTKKFAFCGAGPPNE